VIELPRMAHPNRLRRLPRAEDAIFVHIANSGDRNALLQFRRILYEEIETHSAAMSSHRLSELSCRTNGPRIE
jgi:hypothetical protein